MAKNEDVILKEIDKKMDDFIDTVFGMSQQALVDQQKIDTGNLLKSGNVRRSFLEKEIIYSAPYADVIEYGRSPGTMPPFEVLFKWVRRKLGVRNVKKARSIAYAIALSIKKRGIMPSPYLYNSVQKARGEFKL